VSKPHRAAVTLPGHHKGREPANKGRTYPPEILTPAEISALFAQIPTHTWLGSRNRALIGILYRAGLRHSEALDLMVHDVDLLGGAVHVLRGKGMKRRTVGIDSGAIALINHWLEIRPRCKAATATAPLFCSHRGNRLSVSYLRTVLPNLAREAGIAKRVHPHGLRHTHAYELMMEGVPMPIIQRQLGHTNLATTDRYLSHIAPKDVIDAIRKREWAP